MAWIRGPNEERTEKMTVVISRHWESPNISITVNEEKIEVMCKLDDFVNALCDEIGSPSLMFSRKTLRRRAFASMVMAIEKIKQATIQVMG
jgi:hypothetical protein